MKTKSSVPAGAGTVIVHVRVPVCPPQAADPGETSVALVPTTLGFDTCGETYTCARSPSIEGETNCGFRTAAVSEEALSILAP